MCIDLFFVKDKELLLVVVLEKDGKLCVMCVVVL